MADPISLASGLVALTKFALQSRRALYQAIESFKNNRKAIRDLIEELEALDGVLQSLTETATGNGQPSPPRCSQAPPASMWCSM